MSCPPSTSINYYYILLLLLLLPKVRSMVTTKHMTSLTLSLPPLPRDNCNPQHRSRSRSRGPYSLHDRRLRFQSVDAWLKLARE